MNALCQTTGISRASYYRWRAPPPSIPVEVELRDAIQQIALEFPAYGYRRITRELNRRGFAVNHKRVLRLMRHDNLLCLRRKSFVVTTDSRHSLRVYPNLAGAITPVSVNQLWRADITYIRLRAEFVYLAVVLDAYSRRVIGWALGRTLEAGLAVSALTMALRQRRPAPGLVHHSDRGVHGLVKPAELLRHSASSASLSGFPANWISWPAPSITIREVPIRPARSSQMASNPALARSSQMASNPASPPCGTS